MKVDRRTLPKSVRGAERRGYHIVELPLSNLNDRQTSWLGVNIWCTRQVKGHFVSRFHPDYKFAFQNEQDAVWFRLKWVL